MPKKLEPHVFNKIVDYLTDGISVSKTAKALGISQTPVLTISDYLSIHGEAGKQELYSRKSIYPVAPKEQTTQAREIAEIVEFAYMTHIPMRIVRLIFKRRYEILDEILLIRNKVGHPLYKGVKAPLELPKSVNLETIDNYVRKANDGKSLAEVRRDYEAHLAIVEKTANYFKIAFPCDFRLYLGCNKYNEVESFIELYKQGLSSVAISEKTGISRAQSNIYRRFCEIHGVDELAKCGGITEQKLYTKEERYSIVETLAALNIGSDTGHLIFKCQKGQLNALLKQRHAKGGPLGEPRIAAFPSSANIDWIKRFILDKKENKGKSLEILFSEYQQKFGAQEPLILEGEPLTDENKKTRTVAPSKPAAKHSKAEPQVVSGNSNDRRISQLDVPPRTVGRASLKSVSKQDKKPYIYNPITKEQRDDQERIQKIMDAKGETVPILDELKHCYPNNFDDGARRIDYGNKQSGKVMRNELPKPVAVRNPDGTPRVNRVRCEDFDEMADAISRQDFEKAQALTTPSFLGEVIALVPHELLVKLKNKVIYVPVTDQELSLQELYDLDLIQYSAPEMTDVINERMAIANTCDKESSSDVKSGEVTTDKTIDTACVDTTTELTVPNTDWTKNLPVTALEVHSLHAGMTLSSASSATVKPSNQNILLNHDANDAGIDMCTSQVDSGFNSLKILNGEAVSELGPIMCFGDEDLYQCIQENELEEYFDDDFGYENLSDAEYVRIKQQIDSQTKYGGSGIGHNEQSVAFLGQLCENIKRILPSMNLVDAETYKEKYVGKVGRHPNVIVNSQGFNKLDVKTQVKSVQYLLDVIHVVAMASVKKKILIKGDVEYHGDYISRVYKAYLETIAEIESLGYVGFRGIVKDVFFLTNDMIRYYERIRCVEKLKRTNQNKVFDYLVNEMQVKSRNQMGARMVAMNMANLGLAVGKKTARRIMRRINQPFIRLNRTKKYNSNNGANHNIVTDSVRRVYKTVRPRQIVFTDVMQFTWGKNLNKKGYVAVIVDAYNNEIIAWAISPTEDMSLVLASILKMIEVLPKGVQVVVHTDQGKHYFNQQWVDLLKQHGISRSMSRKAVCNDNALAENIQGIIKEEFFSRVNLKTDDFYEIASKFGGYTHNFNNFRPSQKCDGLSPVVFANKNSYMFATQPNWRAIETIPYEAMSFL